jgi:hypothetical protein
VQTYVSRLSPPAAASCLYGVGQPLASPGPGTRSGGNWTRLFTAWQAARSGRLEVPRSSLDAQDRRSQQFAWHVQQWLKRQRLISQQESAKRITLSSLIQVLSPAAESHAKDRLAERPADHPHLSRYADRHPPASKQPDPAKGMRPPPTTPPNPASAFRRGASLVRLDTGARVLLVASLILPSVPPPTGLAIKLALWRQTGPSRGRH